MTEDEAKAWLAREVSPDALIRLERFVALLVDESHRQNLISAASRDEVWSRHVVDSAQLFRHAGDVPIGSWIDVGSGAGLPGIVIACISDRPVTLVEPRPRRVAFLRSVVAALKLLQTEVVSGKVERLVAEPAAVISARAVGSLDMLFASCAHIASKNTVWILPKGASAESEVAQAKAAWQAVFHVEQSITHPQSRIVIAREVVRR